MLGAALVMSTYLLGSVCFGLVLATRSGVDLRGIGSGNIGATNAGRALGEGTGRLVLALDALKAFVPVLVARLVFGAHSPWLVAVGAAAVLGHLFPLWHGFRGGKGAATAAGVLLAAVPIAGLVAIATYVVLKKATKRASVGSLGGAAAGTAVTLALHGSNAWPTLLALVLLVLVVLRHVDNIARLVRGQEPPS